MRPGAVAMPREDEREATKPSEEKQTDCERALHRQQHQHQSAEPHQLSSAELEAERCDHKVCFVRPESSPKSFVQLFMERESGVCTGISSTTRTSEPMQTLGTDAHQSFRLPPHFTTCGLWNSWRASQSTVLRPGAIHREASAGQERIISHHCFRCHRLSTSPTPFTAWDVS